MIALDLNRSAWNEILFRPRVLVDVETVDMSTSMMGHSTAVPFFICPTGMSKLAHKAGEPGLASAAGEAGVIQIVSKKDYVADEGIHELLRANRGNGWRSFSPRPGPIHAAIRGQTARQL